MNIPQKIVGAIQQGTQNISSAFAQAKQAYQNFQTDLPANQAYFQAKLQQFISPKEMLPTAEDIQKNADQYTNNHATFNPYMGAEKSMSAELQSFPIAPNNPQTAFAEQLKQKIINSGIFRPAMARFLSTVPVYTFYPNQTVAGLADSSNGSPPDQPWETSSGGYQPTIGMALSDNANLNKLTNNPYVSRVMLHELVHTAPRNQAFQNDFKNFFNQINPETNPILYNAGLNYYQNGKPPPNAEEFYATLAHTYGSEALNIPEIKKYYENIFAQQKGLVGGVPPTGIMQSTQRIKVRTK